MRRAEGLLIVSRRQFCGALASCLGLAAVGCSPAGTAIQTGPLGPEPGPDGVDAPNGPDDAQESQVDSGGPGADAGPHADAGVHDGAVQVDAAPAATCPTTGATDAGAPSSIALNTPVYHSTGKFYVVRDSGGLFALSAKCTHAGITVNVSSGRFLCPAHGATFTYNGVVTGGPTNTPLPHYAMCTLANGNVGVVTSQTVSASQRLDA